MRWSPDLLACYALQVDPDTFKILDGIRRKIFILPFRPVCTFGGRVSSHGCAL